MKPMVFGNLPVDTEDYEELRNLWKTTIERCFTCVLPESSAAALGFGLLDSLNATHGNYSRASEKEFNMTVITTVPNVSYHAFTKRNLTLF
jgi:GTP-binding protein LepA